MVNDTPRGLQMQDHAAYKAGDHDFQWDIDRLANSDTVRVILETVMLALNVRFAAVARVTEDRWVACRTVDEIDFGIAEGDEIEIQSTFCQSVRETARPVMFNDAATDAIYGGHPLAAQFGIVSYASIPIYRSDGSFFGTLCAIDTVPRDIKQPRAVAMLNMFADLVGRSLETEERLQAQELLVSHERKLAKIQEEFVAVLGHDLRNPVAALTAGVRMLEKSVDTAGSAGRVLPLMRGALWRMEDLIENMLLHAKSRLGGGIRVNTAPDAPLAATVTEVVNEVRAAHAEQEITLDLDLGAPVTCDAPRLGQALANLLSNAVRHGTPGAPISVTARAPGAQVVLTVTNHGDPIPEDFRAELFRPFRRGPSAERSGLGIGLYIAASITRAHGGTISVDCKDGKTSFTITVPRGATAIG